MSNNRASVRAGRGCRDRGRVAPATDIRGCVGAVPMSTQVGTGDAGQLLPDVGFLLVPGPPFDTGVAYFLVALDPRPTLHQAAVPDGRTNLWGTRLAFLEPESEHSSASAAEGFALAGGRVTNFTAGQGLGADEGSALRHRREATAGGLSCRCPCAHEPGVQHPRRTRRHHGRWPTSSCSSSTPSAFGVLPTRSASSPAGCWRRRAVFRRPAPA